MRTRIPTLGTVAALGLVLGLVLGLAGCGSESDPPDAADSSSATTSPTEPAPGSPASPTESAAPALGTVPPDWLGTRELPRTPEGYGEIRPTPPALRTRQFTLPDTVPPLPGEGFASRIVDPAPAGVIGRSTWTRGCPVGADQLAWVRLTFRGFDGERHTGELLVNARVADDVVRVFEDLWTAEFPIEEMRITTKPEQTAAPTGDGNNTGAFNCRAVRGETSYSQHAYGLAIDLNPFQNPYIDGDLVLPELASAYLDRSRQAPGMIHPDDAVVRAFAGVGWGWGGSWSSLKDLQHFSENGR